MKLCQVCCRVNCERERCRVLTEVHKARFRWNHPWVRGVSRRGTLLGHPVEVWSYGGDLFVGNGHVGARLPAHDGYPELSTSRRGLGGGRVAAIEMARILLAKRLEEGRS